MPRKGRRRIVGKWEQIDRQAREEELSELEFELHREWQEQQGQDESPRRRKRKPKRATQREPAPMEPDQVQRPDESPDTRQ